MVELTILTTKYGNNIDENSSIFFQFQRAVCRQQWHADSKVK